jgi:hypothetical protein
MIDQENGTLTFPDGRIDAYTLPHGLGFGVAVFTTEAKAREYISKHGIAGHIVAAISRPSELLQFALGFREDYSIFVLDCDDPPVGTINIDDLIAWCQRQP